MNFSPVYASIFLQSASSDEWLWIDLVCAKSCTMIWSGLLEQISKCEHDIAYDFYGQALKWNNFLICYEFNYLMQLMRFGQATSQNFKVCVCVWHEAQGTRGANMDGTLKGYKTIKSKLEIRASN